MNEVDDLLFSGDELEVEITSLQEGFRGMDDAGQLF